MGELLLLSLFHVTKSDDSSLQLIFADDEAVGRVDGGGVSELTPQAPGIGRQHRADTPSA